MNNQAIEQAIKDLLNAIGEDVNRDGLKDTPARVGRMYREIFSGLGVNAKDILQTHFETENYNKIILLRDISFYSTCEHHLLPFFGKANIAYIPKSNKVLGLSKLAHLIDLHAKRPQMQERLTFQIAQDLMNIVEAKGAFCQIKARHFCMEMRGIKKEGAQTITQYFLGEMNEKTHRDEIFHMLS